MWSWLPHRPVLKTSSGKVRRAACRERYERGDIGRPQRAVWWQDTLGLGGSAAAPASNVAGVGRALCSYAWSVLGIGAAALWIAVVLLPRLSWRKLPPITSHSSCCGSLAFQYASAGWSISPATSLCW